MAFNVSPAPELSLVNHPLDFVGARDLGKVFSEPVRGSFDNQAIPHFYAEFWGDYECYFLIYGMDRRNGEFLSGRDLEQAWRAEDAPTWLRTNRTTMGSYLAKAMAWSLIPSGFLLAAIALGVVDVVRWIRRRQDTASAIGALLALLVLSSVAGYAWFLARYPFVGGHTVKATYLLQVYPLIALLGAEWMVRTRHCSLVAYRAAATAFAFALLFDLPLFCTRYVSLPWS